jgi:hypothetical protein
MKKLLILVLVVTSCAPATVVLRDDARLETLNIYFENSDQTNPDVAESLDRHLDYFINNFNSQPGHAFDLVRVESPTSPSTLTIRLSGTQLVSKGQQTAGVFVSLVGLALPIIMVNAGSDFYFFFYYFPRVRSAAELSLSPDLSGSDQPYYPALVTSPGLLRSPEKQIGKHSLYFERFMMQLMKRIERDLEKKKAVQ